MQDQNDDFEIELVEGSLETGDPATAKKDVTHRIDGLEDQLDELPEGHPQKRLIRLEIKALTAVRDQLEGML